MTSRSKRRRAAALTLAAALLAGCGGAGQAGKEISAAAAVSTEEETTAASSATHWSKAFSDTDYSVPDGFADEKEGVDYGTLQKDVTYYSTAAGAQKSCFILLPPGYDESKRYPVLYLLHGIDGDPNEWNIAPTIYGNLVVAGKTKPAIIVFADMWTSSESKEGKSENERRKVFHRFDQDLKNDLMPFVNSSYAAAEGMNNTAILGLSTGGAEAVHDAVSDPGVFGYVGALAPEADIFDGSVFGDPVLSEVTFASLDQAPMYTFFCVGAKNVRDLKAIARFEEQFDNAGVPYAAREIEGADHDAQVWTEGFYNFTSRIFKD